jgi:drug/metabolite transporter (DMT)-like permease
MTAISSAAFLGPAAAGLPRQIPPTSSIVALATLGIVHTGVAYWLFYLLINEAGAATASVITYVMPVVALFLGVGLLGERLTGAIAGLILIVLGAWLATSQRTPGDVLASVGRRRTVAADLLQRDGDGEAVSGRGRAG